MDRPIHKVLFNRRVTVALVLASVLALLAFNSSISNIQWKQPSSSSWSPLILKINNTIPHDIALNIVLAPTSAPITSPTTNNTSYGHQMVNSSVRTNTSNVAILYLANQAHMANLGKSIQLLFDNFNSRYLYPIIIFYDDKDGREKFDTAMLLRMLHLKDHEVALISFEYVKFTYPDGISDANKFQAIWAHFYPAYQHMIAFWGYHLYHMAKIRQLEYYLRLDTDTFIFETVPDDFIAEMRSNGYHYGYRAQDCDPAWATSGMGSFLKDYIKRKNLQVAQPDKLHDILNTPGDVAWMPNYYNNFEVVHVPTFTRSDLEDFRKAVYDTKNIYLKRWGDAPQRYLMVNLFLNKSEVHRICNCAVHHQHVKLATNVCT